MRVPYPACLPASPRLPPPHLHALRHHQRPRRQQPLSRIVQGGQQAHAQHSMVQQVSHQQARPLWQQGTSVRRSAADTARLGAAATAAVAACCGSHGIGAAGPALAARLLPPLLLLLLGGQQGVGRRRLAPHPHRLQPAVQQVHAGGGLRMPPPSVGLHHLAGHAVQHAAALHRRHAPRARARRQQRQQAAAGAQHQGVGAGALPQRCLDAALKGLQGEARGSSAAGFAGGWTCSALAPTHPAGAAVDRALNHRAAQRSSARLACRRGSSSSARSACLGCARSASAPR